MKIKSYDEVIFEKGSEVQKLRQQNLEFKHTSHVNKIQTEEASKSQKNREEEASRKEDQ